MRPRFDPRAPERSDALSRAAANARLHPDMRDAALVGVAAAVLLGLLLGAGGAGLVACALLGAAAGGVLGLLLWIETADLPDPPIPAPALAAISRGGSTR